MWVRPLSPWEVNCHRRSQSLPLSTEVPPASIMLSPPYSTVQMILAVTWCSPDIKLCLELDQKRSSSSTTAWTHKKTNYSTRIFQFAKLYNNKLLSYQPDTETAEPIYCKKYKGHLIHSKILTMRQQQCMFGKWATSSIKMNFIQNIRGRKETSAT